MQNQLSVIVDTLSITPTKGGNPVDLSGGFVSFEYYESLFSPHITAYLTILDTGSVSSKTDTQERPADVVSALPIRGNDALSIILCHPTGRLIFGTAGLQDYPLKVKKVSTLGVDKNKKVINLQLVSPIALDNIGKPFKGEFHAQGTLSNTVTKLLTNLIGTDYPSRIINVDPTSNSLEFKLSSGAIKYLDKIIDLATQSVSKSGVPGFFFWESYKGVNFKSTQELMSAAASGDYYHGSGNPDRDAGNNRMLASNEVREFDILSSMTAGAFKTDVITWNPFTHEYTEKSFSLSDANFSTMGSEDLPSFYDSAGVSSRTMSFILNPGNSSIGLSTSLNNDPIKWAALSNMRYNSLFNQEIQVAVPLNLGLQAGQTINLNFPRISQEKIEEGVLDQSKSGKYLILHLSHKFTNTPQRGSTTHMSLIRDTSGLHKGEE